jgi:hypothetical protein
MVVDDVNLYVRKIWCTYFIDNFNNLIASNNNIWHYLNHKDIKLYKDILALPNTPSVYVVDFLSYVRLFVLLKKL